jgi:UDP-galactopyranose mutase
MNNVIHTHDVLVVGAGFAGSVVARELADAGRRVLVIDKRPHIAGNAFDSTDDHGVMVHDYGPHIFHTNSEKVVRWLSRFTNWRFYEHRVLAKVADQLLPIPINRTTINQLYGLNLDEKGVASYYEKHRQPCDLVKTSEDVVLNSVGLDLCEKFFRGYTRKQWGLDLSELSAGVAARIPTRTNDDDRYFSDTYQMMPLDGYTAMFKRMLDHPNITLQLGVDFNINRTEFRPKTLVYTGPVDEFYGFRFGKLPYRSLRFEHSHLSDVDQYQSVGTVNFPNDFEYTRTTEFKHLTGQKSKGTSLVSEYPVPVGDPYYPIPRPENEALFKRYQVLSECESNVYFVGRLAQYRYYNMDQVVASALTLSERISTPPIRDTSTSS